MYQNLPAIPAPRGFTNAASYRNIPIDLSDPRADEPLVKYSDYGIASESFYARTDGGNWPYNEAIAGATQAVWGRRTLAEKLVGVNEYLKDAGVEVFVCDGYRPVECQQGLWDFFARQAEREMPHASAEERKDYVLTFLSNPNDFDLADPTSWPVHLTGGAVDLLLKNIGHKTFPDLGCPFEDMRPIAATSYYEGELQAGLITPHDQRLLNRRLLYAAMMQAGFTNYPHEFWHYDYGDQMYALYATDAPATAWYGYIQSPENNQ